MTSVARPPLVRDARLRSFVEVAAATLDAVAGEQRLATLVVDLIGRTLGAHATVWALPVPGAPMTRLASDHPEPEQTGLSAVLQEWLTEPSGGAEVARFGGATLLPIRVRGRLAGAVAVSRPDGEPLADGDVDFVHALADVAGATMQNARILADQAEVVEELRRQGELLEYISDALIACDPERRIVNWNAGAERVYGYPHGDALGCDVFALLATRFFTSRGVAVSAEDVFEELATAGRWHGELHERRADGAPLTIMCSLTAIGGATGGDPGIVLVNRDVTEQRRDEHGTLHDPLTGLPNRRLLTHLLYEALARRHRSGSALAVLFIDLDTFKPINDTYGHAAGDEVVIETSRRLNEVVRHSDSVSRLGDDAFVVILEEAGTPENIRRVTGRVMDSLARPIDIGGRTVEARPSVGVAVVTAPYERGEIAPETLVDIADEAMYTAKHGGTGVRFTFLPDSQESVGQG